MKILPSETITYRSKLCKDELLAALNNIDRYVPVIHDDTFKLVFLDMYSVGSPKINGVIHQDSLGTILTLSLDLNMKYLFILYVGVGGAFLFTLLFAVQFANGDGNVGRIVYGIGIMVFVYVMTRVNFYLSNRRAKKKLEESLELEEI